MKRYLALSVVCLAALVAFAAPAMASPLSMDVTATEYAAFMPAEAMAPDKAIFAPVELAAIEQDASTSFETCSPAQKAFSLPDLVEGSGGSAFGCSGGTMSRVPIAPD